MEAAIQVVGWLSEELQQMRELWHEYKTPRIERSGARKEPDTRELQWGRRINEHV